MYITCVCVYMNTYLCHIYHYITYMYIYFFIKVFFIKTNCKMNEKLKNAIYRNLK